MDITFFVKNSIGNPVADATCNVLAVNNFNPTEEAWFSKTTNSSGIAVIFIPTDWTAGLWSVTKPGWLKSEGINPYGTVNVVLVPLTPPPSGYGFLEGYVKSQEGSRIEFVLVYVDGIYKTQTNAVGYYGPIQLPVGSILCSFYADGYSPVENYVNILEAQVTVLDVVMTRTTPPPTPEGKTYMFVVGDILRQPIMNAMCILKVGTKQYQGLTNYSGMAYITIPEIEIASAWLVSKTGFKTATGIPTEQTIIVILTTTTPPPPTPPPGNGELPPENGFIPIVVAVAAAIVGLGILFYAIRKK